VIRAVARPSTTASLRVNTSGPKPTSKQLSTLRRLANQTGTSFASPKTKWDASREISRLITLANGTDHRLERSLRGSAAADPPAKA
jgi:hypothetical protein